MESTSTQDRQNRTESGRPDHAPFHRVIAPILFLTSIFFFNFISRIIWAPLMPAIEGDLDIGHGEAGSFFLLISLGYFVTLLGSGFLSSRVTHQKTIALSSALLGFTLLGISLCPGLWAVRVGLVVLGLATGFYIPSAIATLTSMVPTRHWGKAVAIHELAPNGGLLLAPLLSEALMGLVSWRGILALLGIAALALGFAYARFGRHGNFPGEAPSLGSFRVLLGHSSFWIMMVLFGLGVGASMGIYAMLPLYLVAEAGMERGWANLLISFSRISGLGMTFVAGWATDRFGAKRTLIAIYFLTGLTTLLLGAVQGSWLILMVLLQPLIAACFFPPGFAALSLTSAPSVRNVAVSLTVPFSFLLGGGAIPTLIGIAAEAGSFSLGIILVGGLILGGSVLSARLRFPGKQTK
ncbi:MAG: MFS transporter [Desulfobacteraceae bacterium]|jgi:NNP family nitrate/nitrite transporter-like MFS transporter